MSENHEELPRIMSCISTVHQKCYFEGYELPALRLPRGGVTMICHIEACVILRESRHVKSLSQSGKLAISSSPAPRATDVDAFSMSNGERESCND